MPDPITPLTPAQVSKEESQAAKEGWLHRSLVAFDVAFNVVWFHGQPDETLSSHAARAAVEGKLWGKVLSRFLNLFQSDHGADAQAGDVERAQNVLNLEEKSGDLK